MDRARIFAMNISWIAVCSEHGIPQATSDIARSAQTLSVGKDD
jgi:hypothetical protein